MLARVAAIALLVAIATAQTAGTGTPPPCTTFQCQKPLPTLCVQKVNPFGTPQCLNCQRRCGWCIGDPHCETFDGQYLNAQWVGEGVIVEKGPFRVHGVGTVSGTSTTGSSASVLTAVFIKDGTTTLKYYYVGPTAMLQVRVGLVIQPAQPIPLGPTVFGTLTHQTFNSGTDIQVCTQSGHMVYLAPSQRGIPAFGLTISVDPRNSCSSTAVGGILGSPDGLISNDCRTPGGIVVPNVSPQPVLFNSFVLEWVYPTQGVFGATPSIAYHHEFQVLSGPTPFFGDANTLANCPPACNGDFGCCYDFQIMGADGMANYLSQSARLRPSRPCTTGDCTVPLPNVCNYSPSYNADNCANCVRRCAWCLGDPHCHTFDGVALEAQWLGEAVLASQGTFRVHGVADSVANIRPGQGQTSAPNVATVLVALFVQEGTTTLKYYFVSGVPSLQVQQGVSVTGPFTLGPAPLNYGTLHHRNLGPNVYQVCTDSGHIVHIQVNGGSVAILGVTISLNPRTSCSSTAVGGLLGSPDGVISNDCRTSSNTIVPYTSPPQTLFDNFVKTWVYPTQGSFSSTPSIAFRHEFRALDDFTPFYGDGDTLANCPPACNGNFGCCYDYQLLGVEGMNAYLNQYNTLFSETSEVCCQEVIDACAAVHLHCDSIAASVLALPEEFSNIRDATETVYNSCVRVADTCDDIIALCPQP